MDKRKIGSFFEEMACEYLVERGYSILDRNFHAGRIGEIDIVARLGNAVIFIEVKGRRSLAFGTPAEAISATKLRKIKLTSTFYLSQKHIEFSDIKFLVVEILQNVDEYDINVIEDIF